MDAATLVGALVARRAAIEAEIKGQVDELQAIDRLIAHYDLRPPTPARDTPDALPSTLGGPVTLPPVVADCLVPGDGCAVVEPEPVAASEPEPELAAESPADRPGFLPKPKGKVGDLMADRCRRIARELVTARKDTSKLSKAVGLTWSETSRVLKANSRLGDGPDYFDVNGDGWVLTPLGREKLLG